MIASASRRLDGAPRTMSAMTPADAINPAPRYLQWCEPLARFVPLVRGGDGPNDPPADPPAPAPAATAPAGATAEQLTALQAQIDAAAQSAGTEASTGLAKTLGFDNVDALQQFVAAQRKAIEDAQTDEQRREAAIAEREAAAAQREASAAALIRTGVVNLALVRAGVDPANVAAAAPLVTLGDDITDAAADAAVAAVKANPAFASLFGATTTTAPSGVTTKPPATATGGTVTSFQRGAEEYARRHPAKSA